MPSWPKDKLLQHGPDLPMAERIRRYQHNIRAIRASGCAVPTSAYIDTPSTRSRSRCGSTTARRGIIG